MLFTYEDKQILEDAASLIIYHVKRQPTIHKDDKDHIKRIIQHFVPDLFFSRRGELSDTEDWTDEEAEPEEGAGVEKRVEGGAAATAAVGGNGNSNNTSERAATTGSQSQAQPTQSQAQSQHQQQLNGESRRRRCSPSQPADMEASTTSSSVSQPTGTASSTPGSTHMESVSAPTGEKVDLRDPEAEHQKDLDGVYNLFFVNNNWYFFLRLHQTLCSRLLRVYRQAERQLLEYRAEQSRERLLMAEGRREKACDLAMELRLKQPSGFYHFCHSIPGMSWSVTVWVNLFCCSRWGGVRGVLPSLPGYGAQPVGWKPGFCSVWRYAARDVHHSCLHWIYDR